MAFTFCPLMGTETVQNLGGEQEQNEYLALGMGWSRWPGRPEARSSGKLFTPRFWTVSRHQVPCRPQPDIRHLGRGHRRGDGCVITPVAGRQSARRAFRYFIDSKLTVPGVLFVVGRPATTTDATVGTTPGSANARRFARAFHTGIAGDILIVGLRRLLGAGSYGLFLLRREPSSRLSWALGNWSWRRTMRCPGEHTSEQKQGAKGCDTRRLTKLPREAGPHQTGDGTPIEDVGSKKGPDSSDDDRSQPPGGKMSLGRRLVRPGAEPPLRTARRSWCFLATKRRDSGCWHVPILPMSSAQRKPWQTPSPCGATIKVRPMGKSSSRCCGWKRAGRRAGHGGRPA
jgi:hypothetical protein